MSATAVSEDSVDMTVVHIYMYIQVNKTISFTPTNIHNNIMYTSIN